MNRDLQEMPKFSDRWSFLYFEKGRIDQDGMSIAYHWLEKKVQIPIESLAVLMLGPGTTVTHEAVKKISESRCHLMWVGERGVRFYAQGQAGSYSSRHLMQQVSCWANEAERMRVIRQMYQFRFSEALETNATLDQLRGFEGSRVRKIYKELSQIHGIDWQRRNYDQSQWSASDPANRALSAANSCMYGICHAALVTAGFSPAIGFIHSGKQLSFVYDIADLYKMEIAVPIAFMAAASGEKNVESLARQLMRDKFRELKIMKQIIPDVMRLFYGDSGAREDDEISEGIDVAVNY
ncbi:MAG: type I-E CRISPR-associated endonuclease Cas1 [Leptospiraceae bacterium]|nr:type I-E CRISPR-associated endonuclease Cas1 [Leptospiraceae bacterium]MCB1201696.1 type I-E CRISPR-associated endonuclease Cas1 [Leptospiraceae bacterium]